jgi:hypothetical protein
MSGVTYEAKQMGVIRSAVDPESAYLNDWPLYFDVCASGAVIGAGCSGGYVATLTAPLGVHFVHPSVAHLTHLTSLISANRGYMGTLPPEWGSLVNLRVLDVSNNGIFGTIPAEFSGMCMCSFSNALYRCCHHLHPHLLLAMSTCSKATCGKETT